MQIPKKLTLEQFIENARKVHGDKYSYELIKEYKNNKEYLEIICPTHGVFKQKGGEHTTGGKGCDACSGKVKLTTEQFIDKARGVHGNRYDYSKTNYVNLRTPVVIICKEHGEFEQIPRNHIYGKANCFKCGREAVGAAKSKHSLVEPEIKINKSPLEIFLEKAKAKHGSKYSYEKVTEYKTNKVSVTIICPEHGEFNQKPQAHLRGAGCIKCAGLEKLTTENYIEKASKVHENKYDYSLVKYNGMSSPIDIICKEHGVFSQIAGLHVYNKNGCPVCGRISQSLARRTPHEETLKHLRELHKNKYDYSKLIPSSRNEKVTIICPEHGEFQQLLAWHVNGSGCKRCGLTVSGPEEEIANLISSHGFEIIRNSKLPDGKEIDIYVPALNLGIEYNGLWWHSEDRGRGRTYHLDKWISAKAVGIHLIMVYEDEWLLQKDKVLNLLDNHLSIKRANCYARQLKIDLEVPWVEAKELLNRHHLQMSGGPSSIGLGLRNKEGLLEAYMGFSTMLAKSEEIELSRFVSNGRIPGAFSKLLAAFIRVFGRSYSSVLSFSENRWSSGNVYLTNGFTQEALLPPRYFWCKGQTIRKHRRGFQKQYLAKMFTNFDPSKTEDENCRANGYFKVWDCGLTKWRLKIEK